MILVWIMFIWLMAMIIYFGWKWIKGKRKIKMFKKRMKKYEGRLRK